MRSRSSCSPASTFTFRPDARATAFASSATSAGDFAAAGSLTRSRAHATASAIRAPRSSPARTFALAAPDDEHALELRRLRVRLVARNW